MMHTCKSLVSLYNGLFEGGKHWCQFLQYTILSGGLQVHVLMQLSSACTPIANWNKLNKIQWVRDYLNNCVPVQSQHCSDK